ncbi:MAG: helix-turn-helix transcriptional regulator [Alphaproteobacteria bacterium]|nr:helix-turn-helix transcriptional regulator [Alphaproteobacteria bacterium]
MTLDQAASVLAQLGNAHRLAILRLLVKAGPAGLIVGEIQDRLELPASTLAFHLKGLVAAGIVVQEKEVRSVRCRPDFRRLDAVLGFVKEQCCMGLEEAAPARRRAAG